MTQCCVCRASTGTICSPRPVPSAVPPYSANVTSLPSSAASTASSSRARSSFHRVDDPDQRRGRVRAAAGHPAGDRDALAQHEPHVRVAVGAVGQQLHGPPRQVGLVDRDLGDALTVHLDAGLVR